ncbi:MAG TPA: c-type cytochrome biogenesis protein CcsB [Armatimonadota bacterium]|nr:c-type cytochrome biogenesis protein CcsB [Armatimonadota bacterium]
MTIEIGVTLFRIAFGIYLTASVCYIAHLVTRRSTPGKAGTTLLAAGLLVHTASLAARTIAAGRPPFMNVYEFMLSFTWVLVALYLVLEFAMKNKALGAFNAPLTAIFALVALRMPSAVTGTLPALRSAWRVPHISTALLAYAAFGIAFELAIMYLIQDSAGRNKKSFWSARLPDLKATDHATYRTITFGFMMQTLAVVTGAVWAQKAWGAYWSWDPKETWALITWLIYAAYLHMRNTQRWRGRKSAVMAIVGFAATLFTLFGVSFLMRGLHSYTR